MLSKILGINYRTTILGVGVIVAAVGRIAMAFRSKQYDVIALAEDGQLIATTLGALLMGLGLFIAKDANVTGAGTQAKTVDSTGAVTNVNGTPLGNQPTIPPQPKVEGML